MVNRDTAFICAEQYFWHDNGSALLEMAPGGFYQPGPHIETPESKRRFLNLLDVSGLLEQLVRIKPEKAQQQDVLRFHTADYLEKLKTASAQAGGAPFGDGSFVSTGSYEIALLSAGGAIAAFSAVLGGQAMNAYCLNRPPGHHALADKAMGFCLLGNIPIAIMGVMAASKVGRVAVVDWDVHHGNGTEAAFIDNADVLTISLHQDGCYPLDTGAKTDIGVGAGQGANINIPLPPGSGAGAYRASLEKIVIPALHRFKPDLIVVASGFDASVYDPLGRQMLYAKVYGEMTKNLMQAAQTLCEGHLVMTHEGGYSEAYVPLCGLAVIEALSGITTDVVDPFEGAVAGLPYQDLQPAQQDVIEEICRIHGL